MVRVAKERRLRRKARRARVWARLDAWWEGLDQRDRERLLAEGETFGILWAQEQRAIYKRGW